MFNFNKFKKNIFITNSLLILSFTHSILFAQQAPTYNYDQHFYKNDVNTGYNIGASLYALKNTEMQAIIKSVIDEVNSMTEKDRLKFANKNYM